MASPFEHPTGAAGTASRLSHWSALPRARGILRDLLFGLIALVQAIGFMASAAQLYAYHCFVFQPPRVPWICSAPRDPFVPTLALGVAIGLWALALVVWAVGHDMPAVAIFFLTCQAAAGVLTLGNSPPDESAIRATVFMILTCLTAVFYFLSLFSLLDDPAVCAWRRRLSPQGWMWGIICANLATIVLAVSPLGVFGRWIWQAPLPAFSTPIPGTCGACTSFPGIAYLAVWVTFMCSVVMTLAYAVAGYRATVAAATRGRLRILFLGNAGAFLPMVLLSMIPALATDGRTQMPFGLTFPFLLLYPLFYLYALFSGRLTRLQPRLSAFATYYLSAVVLLGFYLGMTEVLGQLPRIGLTSGVPGAIATLIVVLTAFPLRNAIQRIVQWAWADEATDPLSLNAMITERLKLTIDAEELDRHLITALPDGLCLAGAAMLRLADEDDRLLASGSGSLSWIHGPIPLDAEIIRSLIADSARGGSFVRRRTHAMVVSAIARASGNRSADGAADDGDPAHTLPLVLHGELQGVLLLGSHRLLDRREFTAAEVRCLATVAYQAAVALRNIELITANAAAHERFGVEMARRLDRERTRIGDDLHDGPVQQMVALGYLVDEMDRQVASDAGLSVTIKGVRTMVTTIAEALRGLMYSVESPRVVGFGAALESALDAIGAQGWAHAPAIRVEVNTDLPAMPDVVADCLVDIAREAVINVCKHARATEVRVTARPRAIWEGEGVVFEAVDDGQGFEPQQHMDAPSRRRHTGMFRMRRRAEMAGALLSCDSSPGGGTRVRVLWPAQSAGRTVAPQGVSRARGGDRDQEVTRG